ncbi:MAG: cytochrome c oxidase accessory protein CcoG [Candidatus Kapaibacteriota bacterium]
MSIIDIPVEDVENFRNELASIDRNGSRKWIYARQPKGQYYTARTIVATILLIFLFAGPHIYVNGHPFMLLNLPERMFIVFGIPFMPQDFHLVVLLALSALVSVALFTAIAGRIWCGWMCPQTIFLEMVFRRIEWFIEGSPKEQAILNAGRWTQKKILKKSVKHIIFFGISFAIANTFLAYIIGRDELLKIQLDDPMNHLSGLGIITLFSFVFYAVFARFREQACLIACPYGRYQSVLVDKNTIAVTYDFVRGEPRGKQKNNNVGDVQTIKGDCIDCHQCVVVCPTGIDIRNGIQLECVNCTACIDACDHVMTKVGSPKGLIRYTSWEAVKNGTANIFTGRIKAYLAVWIILLSIVAFMFSKRTETETLILRQPGTTFIKQGNDAIGNFFNVMITNKTFGNKEINIKVLSPNTATMRPLGSFTPVKEFTTLESRILVSIPKESATSGKTMIQFGIYSHGTLLETVQSAFIAP